LDCGVLDEWVLMELLDRLTADGGRHFMPGVQALVRFPLEQARRDRATGRRIGTFISGYPGSPLSGYDLALARIPDVLDDHDVTFVPGGNEELAMTAHMGTQMLDDHPHSTWDGVTSVWYGKGPGVDRSGDALKHGNFAGTSEHGAVVILSGEDHEAKSSTMPFQQEFAFESAGVPVLYPSSVAEFRSMGLHAIAMSRYSGCWVALKLTTALCDSAADVDLDAEQVQTLYPEGIPGQPFLKRTDFSFFPGKNIEMERHLYQEKHPAAQRYASLNGLDEVVVHGDDDNVGIVSAGKSYADVRQAFEDLGWDDAQLRRAGVRVLRVGLIYPLNPKVIHDFADGLQTVIVVEEKRDFLERQVRASLIDLERPPRVIGKYDKGGEPLFPVHGAMDADLVGVKLSAVLAGEVGLVARSDRLDRVAEVAARVYGTHGVRTPNFCSGCPHSSSTRLAPGQVAWGAPGCGCFNTVIEQPERHIDVMTQFGGEGAPWVGLSHYTDRTHMVQHLGDGSLYHSSYLNIRWAVAAGVNITFKILYNGVVANTGAQQAVGAHGLADLTRGLESEGVRRIVILTKEPERYRGQRLAADVEVRDARRMVETAAELAEVPGCTVMIYDESCANERRRQIKRGLIEKPTKFVVINEAVCENCGDCGRASNCMSLQKVETEFGTKTRIHSSSCNQDFSCVDGDCPSFVTVETAAGAGYKAKRPRAVEAGDLPEVDRARVAAPFHVYMPGVGGTGVLTLNGILSVAAMLDGYHVMSYDQTGAAQKWGPVVSSLTLVPPGAAAYVARVGVGQADLYLALDEVSGASAANLDRCSPDRTVVVSNGDHFPTGEEIRDIRVTVPVDELRELLRGQSRVFHSVRARWIADEVFGDYMLTNMVVLGAAYQHGLLPLSESAVESAIGLNGVAVDANVQAFRYGRLWVADEARVREIIEPPRRTAEGERLHRRERLGRRHRPAYDALMTRTAELSVETQRLLAVRAAELIDYAAGSALAADYVERVCSVARAEAAVAPSSDRLANAVAKSLYQLMAFKDEYEVARLFLAEDFEAHVRELFDGPVRISYNLAPPAARALGRRGKLRLGPWFRPVFWSLRWARRSRGTVVDPFRRQKSRVEERELVTWFQSILDEVIAALSPASFDVAVALAELPEGIRGYEEVKSRAAAEARTRAVELREQLWHPRLLITPVSQRGTA
jgi:indolepyruvate ferredoxin oxidoreductase